MFRRALVRVSDSVSIAYEFVKSLPVAAFLSRFAEMTGAADYLRMLVPLHKLSTTPVADQLLLGPGLLSTGHMLRRQKDVNLNAVFLPEPLVCVSAASKKTRSVCSVRTQMSKSHLHS